METMKMLVNMESSSLSALKESLKEDKQVAL